MSYMSPPQSRSRVENIKKRFEVTNNDSSTSLTDNPNFTKVSANRSPLGIKTQNNGVNNNFSPKKKVLQATSSTPADYSKKTPNPSPAIKIPQNGPAKAERQLSTPYSRSVIRRSPAFRCDRIVKGRNVTGQACSIREKTRSVVDNRVKLFEDGQSVKSVVRRLNTSPLSAAVPTYDDKTSRPPLQKQAAFVEDEEEMEEEEAEALDSVKIETTSENMTSVTPTDVSAVSKEESSPPNVTLKNVEAFMKLQSLPLQDAKSVTAEYGKVSRGLNPVRVSFLHKYDRGRRKLPSETKRDTVVNRTIESIEKTASVKTVEPKGARPHTKVTFSPNEKNVNKWKGANGVKGEKESLSGIILEEESLGNRNLTLTDSLKVALKAPLPPGPPPKKPPRTFAHNSPSSRSVGQHAVKNSAIDGTSNHKNLPQSSKCVKSALEKDSVERTGKPVRSKTESQIILKKLENVLLHHQQGTGGVVLRPKSPMVKRHVEDKATVTYNASTLASSKPVGRVGPLPSLPSENELHGSQNASQVEQNARFGGCLNFNCVSSDSNNPMYTQIHFYEKVPEKQSEFFVEAPKSPSPPKVVGKSYGTLLRGKSRSVEHIYAEPFEYLNKAENNAHSLQNRKNTGSAMKSGESVGDLSKMGISLEQLRKHSPSFLHSTNVSPKTAVLHYLCTPIHPDGTRIEKNGPKTIGGNESKKTEVTVPTFAERRTNNEPHSLGADCGSEDRKKPSRLRLAALVRGGQAATASDVTPGKVDRMKIQLLMNQAFGSPLQGLPTSALELAGSDTDSMASTPDDGGFVMVLAKPELESAGAQSPDSSKAGLTAAKCVDPVVDGEDSSSINSVEQQEQLTRLSEERKVYVRRVSSRVYQRVRSTAATTNAFPHLFQCILLVGLNLDCADKKTKVPYVKTKYPLDADVPPYIEHLCFPDAKDWPPPVPVSEGIDEQSYSLVITSETGVRRFGYCRRVLPEGSSLCLPLAYCIISPFRASGFYYKILAELESRHGQPEWLQAAFIKELYSCQFPGPGQGLKLSTANTSHNVAGPVCSMITTVVRRPLDSRLEERDLTQLFSALPVASLLQLFGSLLLERKVILISNSLSRLSSCVEALQSILYPFSWQHTLIPVLPASLLDICLSPTPYIVGILRGRDASAIPGPIDESMMVDLDESRVVQCVGDEASILPTRLRRCLKVALELVTNTTQPRDASRNVLVSEAFVRMFVEVCGHYRNHLVTQQDGMKVFEKESFIKAISSHSIRLFLEWFTETAMFSAFMESHLETESDVRGMFDQRCLEHSEEMENNTRLFLRNYKVLNKKVKTFGDRLKDWTPFS